MNSARESLGMTEMNMVVSTGESQPMAAPHKAPNKYDAFLCSGPCNKVAAAAVTTTNKTLQTMALWTGLCNHMVVQPPNQLTAQPTMPAQRIRIAGRVQGVGFRPFVYRLARAHELAGWVRNGLAGVEVHVEGPAAS